MYIESNMKSNKRIVYLCLVYNKLSVNFSPYCGRNTFFKTLQRGNYEVFLYILLNASITTY